MTCFVLSCIGADWSSFLYSSQPDAQAFAGTSFTACWQDKDVNNLPRVVTRPTRRRPRVELATFWSQVRDALPVASPSHRATLKKLKLTKSYTRKFLFILFSALCNVQFSKKVKILWLHLQNVVPYGCYALLVCYVNIFYSVRVFFVCVKYRAVQKKYARFNLPYWCIC